MLEGARYDRHRRDRDERWGDYAAGGGRLTPRRPVVWLAVKIWRALVWVVHRLYYGVAAMTHSTSGLVVLFGALVLMLADASWGSDAVGVPLLGGLAWPLLIAFGAYQYRRRRQWESRVENAVYHVIPGHSRVESEVVWWRDRWNSGRWRGSWDFGFRLPAGCREADLEGLAEHLRERLPAGGGASWMIRWDTRASTGYATLVTDMPDSMTRDEMLDRLEGEGRGVDRDRIPLGVSIDGVEEIDVEATPHILGTGETGKGKSVALLTVVCHAMEHADSWEIIACDPKRVELGYLLGRPGVRTVARDLESIEATIKQAEDEMDRRFVRMARAGVNHIRKLDSNTKRLLVVVDELQQVTMPGGGKDEESKAEDALKLSARAALERIAALGRAAGVHLYLSTQRPDVGTGILTGPLKFNLGGRLAVGKMDQTASMMALDTDAATQLPSRPKGRAIWRGIEGEKRIQVAFTQETDLPKGA